VARFGAQPPRQRVLYNRRRLTACTACQYRRRFPEVSDSQKKDGGPGEFLPPAFPFFQHQKGTSTMPNPPTGFAPGLTLTIASRIAEVALAKGRELSLAPLTVVVLDQAATAKLVLREDGASLLRPEIAHGKAYGAMALGFGGRELARRSAKMPGFMNAFSDLCGGRAVPVPGGVLVRDASGTILGAVGISGDASDKDEVCAVAGIEAVGLVADTGDPE
jgi:uncharacterized protein GlcG (DUF336 family)